MHNLKFFLYINSFKTVLLFYGYNNNIFNNSKRAYSKKPFKYLYGYIKKSPENMKTFRNNMKILEHKGWIRETVKVKYENECIKEGKEIISSYKNESIA